MNMDFETKSDDIDIKETTDTYITLNIKLCD